MELFLNLDLDAAFEIQVEDTVFVGLVFRFSRIVDEKAKRQGNVICSVFTDTEPKPKIREILLAASPPFPNAVKAFADDLQRRLCDTAERVLRLLRWFRGGSDGHNPIRLVGSLAYSLDGNDWRALPTTINLNVVAGIPRLIMADAVAKAVANLWKNGAEEPLAHELLREALDQEHKNPRSALVIGVAAAEVGFKQLVGKLVPDAKWLVDNVPSPPLERMLTDYLPDLPSPFRINKVKPRVPQGFIATVKKAVNLRNQIVHGKAPQLSGNTLHEILIAAHDCLYFFDCYGGHRWAWDRITIETQRLIIQESSGD